MSTDGSADRVFVARDEEFRTVVARNAFYLVVGQATTTALAIVFNAALGRFLGADEFGRYYLMVTMLTFAYVLVEWGQPTFVIPHVARAPSRAGDMLGTALLLRAAFATLVTALAWLAAGAFGYDARTRRLSVLFIVASVPLFLAHAYGMVFRARDRMGRDATVSVANKAVGLGLTLPALVVGAGIPGVILAQGVAGVAAVGIAAALYGRLRAPPLRASLGTARELLAGGTPIVLMTAAVAAQPYLDALILSWLAPATVVGWFGAARTLSGTLTAPAAILGSAMYPRLARASTDTPTLQREVRSALRPLLWLGGLAAAGTYLFASTAVAVIYGPERFGPAATVLEVAAPGLFLVFMNMMLTVVIYATSRGTAFAMAKVASVLVGTGLNFSLIPVFQERFGNGGIGVVVAFALSELVVLAAAVIVLGRGTLQPAMALDVLRALGAIGATLLLFRLIPPVSPWVGVPLCIAGFGAASFVVGLIGPHDLAVLGTAVWRQRTAAPRAGESG
jgi:O-antigen/teichoic acid export membrane protein